MQVLTCPYCKVILKVNIGFTGCYWNCKKEDPAFGWEVSLHCESCGSLFTIGHIKNYFDFAELKPELRCVD